MAFFENIEIQKLFVQRKQTPFHLLQKKTLQKQKKQWVGSFQHPISPC